MTDVFSGWLRALHTESRVRDSSGRWATGLKKARVMRSKNW